MKNISRFILAAFLLLGLYGGQPAHAAGATLSISPSSTTATVGGNVTVAVNLSSSDAINSASGTIVYTGSVLSATSVSTSGSIFTFWTTQPVAGSSIAFGGGLSTPGFAGTGKVFSITFKVLAAGTGTVSVVGGQILANDGAGTNIYSGASGGSITTAAAQQPLTAISISSSSHPSQSTWYKTKDAAFSWNKPSDVTSFNYTLSSSAGAADRTGSGANTTASFTNLTDGVWTLTLSGQSPKQTRTATYKIQIDNAAPDAFAVKVTQNGSTDPYPTIGFAATDALSGIDHYVVTVDGQNPKQLTDSTLKLDRLVPGHHQVSVTAFDRAGNSAVATADIQVEGFPGPTITGYPKFVSVLEPISLQGQALYGATIQLYVDGQAGPSFAVKENLSNRQRQVGDQTAYKDGDQVEWNFFYSAALTPGKHTFSAIQIKSDTSQSSLSNVVTVPVLWSSVSLYGWTLPFAIVSAGLGVIIILLIILLIWVARRTRRAVSDWRDRLVKVRKKVDSDLVAMEKDVARSTEELGSKSKTDLRDLIEKKMERQVEEIDKVLDASIQTAEKEELDNNQPK